MDGVSGGVLHHDLLRLLDLEVPVLGVSRGGLEDELVVVALVCVEVYVAVDRLGGGDEPVALHVLRDVDGYVGWLLPQSLRELE